MPHFCQIAKVAKILAPPTKIGVIHVELSTVSESSKQPSKLLASQRLSHCEPTIRPSAGWEGSFGRGAVTR